MNNIQFYVGLTDRRWYDFLRQEPRSDVNFWKPSAKTFKALPPNGPFLFLLKKPAHAIVGMGYFAGKMAVPLREAWNIFGPRNGVGSYEEFHRLIYGNRYGPSTDNATILCLTLNTPVFFEPADWVPAPADWGHGIVQGKRFNTGEPAGLHLWQRVDQVLQQYRPAALSSEPVVSDLVLEPVVSYRTALRQVRPEQRAFQEIVKQAYDSKCAISGEKTVPVLEAAHIKPYAEAGPSIVSNGLLLRSDLHRLFDRHYLTINADSLRVEVSKRIKEEFSNGVAYYQYDGQKLRLPHERLERPAQQFLRLHNERYKG
ncbi:HNH endonuclease [Hymenobacter sp. RP-2-7]|uniref:HNH endonuclease n=1 Tax=Hymenobacter polaris TaxID=2682546 RepID=A0A7Y0ADX1_9BACT|nr:HNH endonuclease [Hymenobacter polaris]NML65553.1 HNH endonuclease [Hymenobacter polaris]